MKRITIKGLADYMTASAARQRKILREFKYPNEDEAQAKILYYREARDGVSAFCRKGRDPSWLAAQVTRIDGLASAKTGRARTRLRHNARGLRSYGAAFSARAFDLLSDVRLALLFGDVAISVVPDLHVLEGGVEKLVKLEFGVNPPDPQVVKIITQGMFDAAAQAGIALRASAAVILDVHRGTEHRGARMGSRLRTDIEATCKTISAVWDTI